MNQKYLLVSAAVLAFSLFVTGCSGAHLIGEPTAHVQIPEKDTDSALPITARNSVQENTSLGTDISSVNPRMVTTLDEALQLVLNFNPIVKSHSYRLKSAAALVEQAARYPNPEVEIELEEFGGNTDGFDQAESTIGLSQPLELGGKRAARTTLAAAERDLRQLEADILLGDVITETKIAFADVVMAQSLASVLEQQISLSRKAVSATTKKLTAGSILAVEKTKAEISLQSDELKLRSAQNNLLVAKRALASLWGGSHKDISIASGNISLQGTESLLLPFPVEDSPRYKKAKAEATVAEKSLFVEKSLAVPDASVGIGYKRLEESETNALLGTFSIGLPVLNRNQGAIESAAQELKVASLQQDAMKIRLERELSDLQASLRTYLNEYRAIRDSILPQAKSAFHQAEEAYNIGRTSFLDLLDAQRTLVETKSRHQELLRSCLALAAKIENITGASLSALKENIK